jgi:L-2-hydroxyglutarate oxidase LhgO
MKRPTDVVGVGAGILGLPIAKELLRRRPQLNLLALDKKVGSAAISQAITAA